jgi:hypothetical protein
LYTSSEAEENNTFSDILLSKDQKEKGSRTRSHPREHHLILYTSPEAEDHSILVYMFRVKNLATKIRALAVTDAQM